MRQRKRLTGAAAPEDESWVISSRFGDPTFKYRCGRIVRRGRKTVDVEFKDEEGTWTERYSLRSGIRTTDIGSAEGWRVSPKELDSESCSTGLRLVASVAKSHGLDKLHEEEHKYDGGQILVLQVWRERGTEMSHRSLYLKAFRKFEGDDHKHRELPAVVPFRVLVELLAQFTEV